MFPFLFSIYFASAILFITHDWKKQKKTKQMKRLVALFCSHAKTKNVSVRTDLKYLTTRNMTNLISWHSNQTWIDQNRRSEENKLERNQVSLRQSDFQENQTILTWFEIQNLLVFYRQLVLQLWLTHSLHLTGKIKNKFINDEPNTTAAISFVGHRLFPLNTKSFIITGICTEIDIICC